MGYQGGGSNPKEIVSRQKKLVPCYETQEDRGLLKKPERGNKADDNASEKQKPSQLAQGRALQSQREDKARNFAKNKHKQRQ